jgi:hypothetical protein
MPVDQKVELGAKVIWISDSVGQNVMQVKKDLEEKKSKRRSWKKSEKSWKKRQKKAENPNRSLMASRRKQEQQQDTLESPAAEGYQGSLW